MIVQEITETGESQGKGRNSGDTFGNFASSAPTLYLQVLLLEKAWTTLISFS